MSDRRRSAAALSSRAHAFSVEALIGSNRKRKLRGWDDKDLELSMESLAAGGPLGDPEDRAPCLDMEPGQCARSPRPPPSSSSSFLLSLAQPWLAGWRAVEVKKSTDST